jgi:hypothetical protein
MMGQELDGEPPKKCYIVGLLISGTEIATDSHNRWHEFLRGFNQEMS